MHVSFVLDEAGSSTLEDFFERKAIIVKLYHLLDCLAKTVRLIVCGTCLAGQYVSFQSDVVKIHMQVSHQRTGSLVPVGSCQC
jgi:hypothetical protein